MHTDVSTRSSEVWGWDLSGVILVHPKSSIGGLPKKKKKKKKKESVCWFDSAFGEFGPPFLESRAQTHVELF
jgi:hypothetical protein